MHSIIDEIDRASGAEGGAAQPNLFPMLRTLLEDTHEGLWDWDIRTDEVAYSRQWAAIVGYPPQELAPSLATRYSILHPDDKARADDALHAYIRGDAPRVQLECRMVRKDGSIVWIQEKGVAVEWDEAGAPVRMMGMIHDITDVKREEENLRAEMANREYVARLAGLGAWECDIATGRIVFGEDCRALLGFAPEEISGPIAQLRHFVLAEDLSDLMRRMRAYIGRDEGVFSMDLRVRRKDGREITVLVISSIVERDAQGKAMRMRGGLLDIDDRVRTQQALVEALRENEQHNTRLREEVDSAVDQLAQSQSYAQSIFDANPHINLLCDDHFEVIDCNRAAVDGFGFPDKEALLKSFMPFLARAIPPYQADGRASISLVERFKATVEQGYTEFETELAIRESLIPFHVVMKKIAYKDSFAIVAYMIDLHAIREARTELIRQDRMLRAVNDCALLLMGSQGQSAADVLPEALRLLAESANAHRAYVWRNETIDGRLCAAPVFCWPESQTPSGGSLTDGYRVYDEFMPIWRKTLLQNINTNTVVRELREKGVHYEGPPDAKSLLITPIFLQGEFWGFVGYNDCAEERRFDEVEEKLLKAGGMLAAAYLARTEMTEKLVAARELAEASTRAKSDFLSRMSHEIRTPMNAIIGMTTIAKKSDDIGRIRYCLEKIDAASTQLLGIINDVLDMSKIEANKFEIAPHEFNFEKMVQNVINVIGVRIDEKGQHFLFDFRDILTRSVVSDELRLSQVLINLLSNAVKFTAQGGDITLKISFSDTAGESSRLRVEVTDNGIGIAQEQVNRLFNAFEQAESGTTRKFGGTGLGLSICKKIVNLMGGDIFVKSEPGKGSTFWFDIEVGWGADIEGVAEQLRPREDIRVLVVDDAFDVLDYFKSILGSYSLTCDTASGGREAVAMVQKSMAAKEPYDIIFLDWNMPDFSGGETARAIKKINDQIIVVMISVADWADIEKEVRPLGVTHFLSKPVLPSALYNTVVTLTEKSYVTERAEEGEAFDWSGKIILLAEDIEINREIITSILEETNVRVECAENGLEAIRMLQAAPERYQLIMMDVQMPELDGLGATRRIRAMQGGRGAEIPIIAMTANAFKEDVRECLDAGMNDHIAKPINVDEMLGTLARYME